MRASSSRAHFLHREIGATNRDFVHAAVLLSGCTDDARERLAIQLAVNRAPAAVAVLVAAVLLIRTTVGWSFLARSAVAPCPWTCM
jgi:hypothetical protein